MSDSQSANRTYVGVGITFFISAVAFWLALDNATLAIPFAVLGITFTILGMRPSKADESKTDE